MRHGKRSSELLTPNNSILILYRAPPPLNSKPEGFSLQQKTYTMSEDTNLFQPPSSYPEAPKNMYYQVPAKKPEPERIAQIFPWETRAPKPTRVFAVEHTVPTITVSEEEPRFQATDQTAALQELSSSARRESPAESWDSYSRSNAWDEDPQIQRYIESMTQGRRGKTQVISGNTSSSTTSPPTRTSGHRPSIILTDFPTESERPSLPVTPAPIQRKFSGDDGLSQGQDPSTSTTLPVAEGVPTQEAWVGVTVEAFSFLIRATYLLWRSTESPGPARRAPPATVGRSGGPKSIAGSVF